MGRAIAIGLLVLSVIFLIAAALPWAVPSVAGAVIVTVVVAIEGHRFRVLHARLDTLNRAVEQVDGGLMLLEHSTRPVKILGTPVIAKWNRGTISLELADFLLQFALLTRPVRIVECGAGVSTRLLASCLRQLGAGRLISLEHDRFWVREVNASLEAEGLSRFAEVWHAPMEEMSVEGRRIPWYAASVMERLRGKGPFDLAFVDGPPAARPGDPGREGTLHALLPLLREGGWLLLDDGNRPGERETVERWKAYYGEGIEIEYIDLQWGLWRVRKKAVDDRQPVREADEVSTSYQLMR
jgi:predicted O-methyltransferase YrrM